MARALLAPGADGAATEMPSGNTAIHKAADKGHEGVVRALIEAGVDFDCKDAEGQTALDLAKGGGQAGVEALLVEAGGRRGKMEAFVEEGLGFMFLSLGSGHQKRLGEESAVLELEEGVLRMRVGQL